MTARAPSAVLAWHVLRVTQPSDTLLYLLSPTASEVLHVADIFQVSRNDAGDPIGYHHPEAGVMAAPDPTSSDAAAQMRGGNLARLISQGQWTAGRWEALDLHWNEIQNVLCHTHELPNFLVRTYLQARAAQR